MTFGKIEIEKAVLCNLLLDTTLELNWLEDDDFYDQNNKKIFTAIKSLKQEWIWVDMLTVSNRLSEQWTLDIVWWNLSLVDLTNATSTSAHYEQYVGVLQEERKRVQLYQIAQEMMIFASDTKKVNWEVFNYSKRLMDLNTMWEKQYDIDSQIYGLMDYLSKRKDKELFWYSWWEPFKFLDEASKWIQKGICYRIGAPSNTGKTQMVYTLINNLMKQDAKVLFFTLEMNTNFTLSNILANHQWINNHAIERGDEEPDIDYIKSLEGKLYIIDDVYSLSEIMVRTQEINPDVVILDFIWQVKIKGFAKEKMFDEYATQIKEFVKRSGVSWIDLSNLPKSEQWDEFLIRQGWFNGSADLKNLADVWIHLYEHKNFKEFRKQAIEMWNNDYMNYSCVNIVVTKNRIWNRPESICKIDFNRWGKFEIATQQELKKWETSFL